MDTHKNAHIFPRVIRYLMPYRLGLLGVLGLLLVINLCELLKPWPLKLIIDHVLNGHPLNFRWIATWSPLSLLIAACIGLVFIHILSSGLTLLFNYASIRLGQHLVHTLRGDLYDHLQRLSLKFHSQARIGDLLHRVTADTFAMQSLTMNSLFPIVSASVLVLGMTVIMLRLDWMLTLVALSICPALLLTISRLNRRIGPLALEARQREGAVYSVVQRTLSSIKVMQAFTTEPEEHQKFMAASQESLGSGLRLNTQQTLYSGAVNTLIAIGTALVLGIGAVHVLGGKLSLGELVVFVSYLASLYGPMNTLVHANNLIQDAKAGLRRVFEVLDVQGELCDGPHRIAGQPVRGQVTFDRVCFEYMPGHPVLRGIDLEIAPGQKIAIVGPTGAGKSTLVSLIPRFADPLSGRVLLDGRDLRDYSLRELRAQIAMVLQPPLVFPVSLRENIAYGRSHASLEQVQAAARLAGIHDAIERLPNGYETVVGEQGVTLSEGERQRITIARAILRDASILILDEPTSSVDHETEAKIMAGLNRLMARRTTFIIAHRLSTVRNADRIVVVRDGRIVEQGTFVELVNSDGPFRQLYFAQWGGSDESVQRLHGELLAGLLTQRKAGA
jgi:ATP-binding cassette, subfamily B, bacterial